MVEIKDIADKNLYAIECNEVEMRCNMREIYLETIKGGWKEFREKYPSAEQTLVLMDGMKMVVYC